MCGVRACVVYGDEAHSRGAFALGFSYEDWAPVDAVARAAAAARTMDACAPELKSLTVVDALDSAFFARYSAWPGKSFLFRDGRLAFVGAPAAWSARHDVRDVIRVATCDLFRLAGAVSVTRAPDGLRVHEFRAASRDARVAACLLCALARDLDEATQIHLGGLAPDLGARVTRDVVLRALGRARSHVVQRFDTLLAFSTAAPSWAAQYAEMERGVFDGAPSTSPMLLVALDPGP